MNVRRGLFRLWVVSTTIFVLAAVGIMAGDIKREFDRSNESSKIAEESVLLVPVACSQARGELGVDYVRLDGHCWYEIPKFRSLFTEYKDLSKAQLKNNLYRAAGISISQEPAPWRLLGMTAAIAFGIPLALFAFGRALVWAFAGFTDRARGG